MAEPMSKSPLTSYVVVLSAESSARFFEGGVYPMVVRNFPSAVGPATVTYRTRYADEGYAATVPREYVDRRTWRSRLHS